MANISFKLKEIGSWRWRRLVGRISQITLFSVTSGLGLRLSRQGDTHVIAYRKSPMPRTAEPTSRTYPIPPVHRLPLTGHRERLCLKLLLACFFFFFCLVLLPQTGRGAKWYKFHEVADYGSLPNFDPNFISPAPTINLLQTPSINAAGHVVFTAAGGDAQHEFKQVVFRGGVGSGLDEIVNTTQSALSYIGPECTINDLGDVAFWGKTNQSPTGADTTVVRYRESTQNFTTIASGAWTGNSQNATFKNVKGASINNAGAVAFKATPFNDTGLHHIVAGTGGSNWTYVDVDVPTNQNSGYRYPLMRVDSPTLDVLRYRYTAGYPFATYVKGGSLNPVTIAASPSSQFEWVPQFGSIRNTGGVSFVADPVGPTEWGVYVGAGGAPMLHADTNGEFEYFGQTAASSAGVAFYAKKDLGGWGVYTGPNALQDKVLAQGDSIPGHPTAVSSIDLYPTAMNDRGQIAMRVLFEDSTQKIIRADPFILHNVSEWWMAIAAIKTDGDASMSQMVEFAPGNESLAFDFAFPADTGNLVVSLGGNVLAEIGPTDGVSDDLTRFETEVDLAALFPEGTAEALLEFQLYSNDATAGLYLDNIHFASLENGDFATGDLYAWQSSFIEGDGVGVAVNPYGPSPAVPEPATLLLALFGLALVPRKRRR